VQRRKSSSLARRCLLELASLLCRRQPTYDSVHGGAGARGRWGRVPWKHPCNSGVTHWVKMSCCEAVWPYTWSNVNRRSLPMVREPGCGGAVSSAGGAWTVMHSRAFSARSLATSGRTRTATRTRHVVAASVAGGSIRLAGAAPFQSSLPGLHLPNPVESGLLSEVGHATNPVERHARAGAAPGYVTPPRRMSHVLGSARSRQRRQRLCAAVDCPRLPTTTQLPRHGREWAWSILPSTCGQGLAVREAARGRRRVRHSRTNADVCARVAPVPHPCGGPPRANAPHEETRRSARGSRRTTMWHERHPEMNVCQCGGAAPHGVRDTGAID